MTQNLTCPDNSRLCEKVHGSNLCIADNGICCYIDNGKQFCRCLETHTGPYCQKQIVRFSAKSAFQSKAEYIAVFASIFGVLIILFCIAVIFLQVKYYKRRKKRFQEDQEIKKSMRIKPDIQRKDNTYTRLLTAQPGYSWRQSVRRSTSHSSRKLAGPSSDSVPEDLFKFGLTTTVASLMENGQIEKNEGTNDVDKRSVESSEGKDEVGHSTEQLLPEEHQSKKVVQFEANENIVVIL